MSLDGKVTSADGQSKWITGEESRRRVHLMRSRSDCVITGSGTVQIDDPSLTARIDMFEDDRPLIRAILDTHAKISPSAKIFHTGGNVLWFMNYIASPVTVPDSAEVVRIKETERGLDLHEILQSLGDRGCIRVMIEAGPKVSGSFFDERLADRVDAFLAPIILGGFRSLGAIEGTGAQTLASALKLDKLKIERIGSDVLISGYPLR